MHVDRAAKLTRQFAAGTGLFVGLAATAVYLRHHEAPGAKELWELGLLVAAELGLVTAGLTFIAQCIAHRAQSAATRSPVKAHELGQAQRKIVGRVHTR